MAPSLARIQSTSTPCRRRFSHGYTLAGNSQSGTATRSPGRQRRPEATRLIASGVFLAKAMSPADAPTRRATRSRAAFTSGFQAAAPVEPSAACRSSASTARRRAVGVNRPTLAWSK
jgi:hypothetical protein